MILTQRKPRSFYTAKSLRWMHDAIFLKKTQTNKNTSYPLLLKAGAMNLMLESEKNVLCWYYLQPASSKLCAEHLNVKGCPRALWDKKRKMQTL